MTPSKDHEKKKNQPLAHEFGKLYFKVDFKHRAQVIQSFPQSMDGGAASCWWDHGVMQTMAIFW